jgi:hypothetical protein
MRRRLRNCDFTGGLFPGGARPGWPAVTLIHKRDLRDKTEQEIAFQSLIAVNPEWCPPQ